MDLLVDLDGTLVEPADGIIASFQKGLAAVGAPAIEASKLSWIIGPPLRQSFPQAGVAVDDVERALAAYRVHYRGGAMFSATPYPGIDRALADLTRAGHRLIVATSKPHAFAKPILQHFHLAAHFAAIHGAELDGRNDDKGDLIGHIRATEKVDVQRALMIGDRKFDCMGASRHGIRTIGVLWGHGSEVELRAAGAVALAEDTGQLSGIVASLQ